MSHNGAQAVKAPGSPLIGDCLANGPNVSARKRFRLFCIRLFCNCLFRAGAIAAPVLITVSSFEVELLDSDGLDNSREAEEESKLCSVLNKSVLNERQCQAKAVDSLRDSTLYK